MPRVTVTAALTLTVTLVARPNALAQAAHVHQLPIAVNGATNPELIPDSLAFRHYFLAIAISRDAPAPERERRASLLATAGLSSADGAALIACMDGVRERLATLSDNSATGRATRDSILDDAIARAS